MYSCAKDSIKCMITNLMCIELAVPTMTVVVDNDCYTDPTDVTVLDIEVEIGSGVLSPHLGEEV